MVVSKTGELSMQEVMNYKPSRFFPSLFQAKNLFREANKPHIAFRIADLSCKVSAEASKNHPKNWQLCPWRKVPVVSAQENETTKQNKNKNKQTIKTNKQTKNSHVYYADSMSTAITNWQCSLWCVWWGPSLKDNTHQRHGQNIHPVVHLTEERGLLGTKDNFLPRASSK